MSRKQKPLCNLILIVLIYFPLYERKIGRAKRARERKMGFYVKKHGNPRESEQPTSYFSLFYYEMAAVENLSLIV